jgi:predicted RNase H-like HicB family nuclease
VFERDEDGGYAVMCPSIPGCISQGDTVEQATANIRDAILLCLEDMQARGEPLPLPTEVTTGIVDIAV